MIFIAIIAVPGQKEIDAFIFGFSVDFHRANPYNEYMNADIRLGNQPLFPGTTPIILIDPIEDVKEPSLYQVVLLNDDFTPMEFVIDILKHIFHKDYKDAFNIMMQVHRSERGVAGTYFFEIAEEKMQQVLLSAKARDYPLNCIIEPI